MSETTPRNSPAASRRSASTPDFVGTTWYPFLSSALRTYAITVASSSINNTGRLVALIPALLMQDSRRPHRLCFVAQWQTHDKRGAYAVGIVVTGDFSTVLAHDSVANAQPQPCAFSNSLGGEERIKNPLRVLNAVAVIAKDDFGGAVEQPGLQQNPRRPASFAHRVVSVVQDIQEHLLQLVRIADNVRQRFIQQFF